MSQTLAGTTEESVSKKTNGSSTRRKEDLKPSRSTPTTVAATSIIPSRAVQYAIESAQKGKTGDPGSQLTMFWGENDESSSS